MHKAPVHRIRVAVGGTDGIPWCHEGIPLRYLIALLLAGTIIMLIAVFYGGKEPPVSVPAPPPPAVPAATPKPRLHLQITDCKKVFGYTQTSGYVENTGEVPVRFVSVMTVWKDADSRVVDTGTIYVVGSEDLNPGESSPFQDNSNHSQAQKCFAKLEDFWSYNRQ
jgi:hypothetical protein